MGMKILQIASLLLYSIGHKKVKAYVIGFPVQESALPMNPQ